MVFHELFGFQLLQNSLNLNIDIQLQIETHISIYEILFYLVFPTTWNRKQGVLCL